MKIEIILGRIFLSLIAVVVTFVTIDFASRWVLPSSRSSVENKLGMLKKDFRKPKPYVMFGGVPGASTIGNERLNSMGYRGDEPLSVKPEGEFRIILLGGSTVFMGNPTLAVLLEEQFKKNGFKGVRVYNFGVMASVSGMELARIVFEVVGLKPDLIVMYGGGNDIYQPAHYDPRPGFPYNFMVYENNPVAESDINSYPTTVLLAYGSNLCRYLFPSFFVNHLVPQQQLRKDFGWGSREWGERLVSQYIGNLEKADTISRAFGAHFMALFQPMVHYKNGLTKEEAEFGGNISGNYKYLRDVIRSEAARRKHLDFVDVSNIFEKTSETVFTDQIHILQKHYQTVADEMFRHISKLVPK